MQKDFYCFIPARFGFAFAGNFDYSYQLDDSSLNYEFGTSRTTIENGVNQVGKL